MTNDQIYKLSANENCYGCSPAVLKAIKDACKLVRFYPESNHVELKEILANKHGVSYKGIVIGAGSVEIIDCLIQAFSEIGDEVITFENTFVMYEWLAISRKRVCKVAPLTNFCCKPVNIIPLVNNRTRLIFIANPNNPTGTIILHDELEELLNLIPTNVIVVVDEAYSEYTTDLMFPDSVSLQRKFANLVILHSFSKIYGIAGLRIGYGIMAEEIAAKISTVQIPNTINYLAPAAAKAALADVEFTNDSMIKNEWERNYLFKELANVGYNILESQANFLYLWFNEKNAKGNTLDLLTASGVYVCDLKVYGQERSLRITVGTNLANRKIVQILSDGGMQ
jgi:histidinol-phosphate aminotransferase